MAETYRVPKSLLDTITESTLSLEDVAALRNREDIGQEARSWADAICAKVEERAAVITENDVEMTENEVENEVETDQEPSLSEELTELLADVFALYLYAHAAHWNVVGPDFAQYHELFEEIYNDLHSSIDPIAENIRKLGEFTPSQLQVFADMSEISNFPATDNSALALATHLLTTNDVVIGELVEVFQCATMFNQQGIANFIAERIDTHQKWKWQLTSSLGSNIPTQTIEEPIETVTGEQVDRTTEENSMIEERKAAIAQAERITMNAEVRAVDTDGKLQISGYAATFNQEATGLQFREIIAPGAFKRTLSSDNPVFLLVNHDTEQLPLASTQSGTLRLTEDEIGLRIDADLDPSNPRAAELASALSRGDVDKMSFAFTVAPDGEERNEGVRTLKDLNLFEVSVVTWPAYDSTTVGLRNEQAEDLTVRARIAKAKLTNFRLKSKR